MPKLWRIAWRVRGGVGVAIDVRLVEDGPDECEVRRFTSRRDAQIEFQHVPGLGQDHILARVHGGEQAVRRSLRAAAGVTVSVAGS